MSLLIGNSIIYMKARTPDLSMNTASHSGNLKVKNDSLHTQ